MTSHNFLPGKTSKTRLKHSSPWPQQQKSPLGVLPTKGNRRCCMTEIFGAAERAFVTVWGRVSARWRSPPVPSRFLWKLPRNGEPPPSRMFRLRHMSRLSGINQSISEDGWRCRTFPPKRVFTLLLQIRFCEKSSRDFTNGFSKNDSPDRPFALAVSIVVRPLCLCTSGLSPDCASGTGPRPGQIREGSGAAQLPLR